MGGYIFLGILIAIIFVVISVYNRLVALCNRYKNAFAQIDVQLKRRYDLIPNLVETAKAYMSHERETLEAVIAARNTALAGLQAASNNPSAGNIQSLNNAEGLLSGALGKFQMVMEAYPDLKASENMTQLSEELTSTENKVAFARQAYNDGVMEYNTYRQSFPAAVFANFFGHTSDAALLEFADKAEIEKAPSVSF